MTNRILSGIHILADEDQKNFYPVAVYFRVVNKKTVRETGLVSDQPFPTLNHALDCIENWGKERYNDDCSIAGVEYTLDEIRNSSIKLDNLHVQHPRREKIGTTFYGRIVGWHIDLKLNARSKRPACILTNIAWMCNGSVNYATIDKTSLFVKSPEDIECKLDEVFFSAFTNYVLGAKIKIGVIPSGKDRAKYAMLEYTKPMTFMETVCHTLRQTIH